MEPINFRSKRKKQVRVEDPLQIDIIRLIETRIRGARVVHVPNQRANMLEAIRMKRLGAAKGFPDLIVYLPVSFHMAEVYAEVKAPGRKRTPEQIEWADYLRQRGRECPLWDSLKAVDRWIDVILQCRTEARRP